jgi:hypothetical protein
MLRPLNWIARHGREALIAGLIAGLALPELAQAMRPWIPAMIALMLLVVSLRIGPRAALGGLEEVWGSVRLVLVLQLGLPLLVLGCAHAFGVVAHPLATVAVLVLSAPSVTGSPTFTILLGHNPAPALRLLVVGTAIFPLTAIPALLLLPSLGDPWLVVGVALRLILVIFAAVGLGFALNRFLLLKATPPQTGALDGVATLLQAVVVIGLMSALGPALETAPLSLLNWLIVAFVLNFGLQIASARVLGQSPLTPARSVVAGNRNVALFLVALPEPVVEPLLIFIGCYQIPMYLTPTLMRRLYGPGGASA